MHMMIQEPSKVILNVLLTHLDVKISLILFLSFKHLRKIAVKALKILLELLYLGRLKGIHKILALLM